jgi:hypothetical protein
MGVIPKNQKKVIIMTTKKKILLIGWDPKVGDYSKWPDLNAEKLGATLEAEKANIISQGYDVKWCFVTHADSAADDVNKELENENYDCVLIGAGVRINPDAFIVFEVLVNTIHAAAPQAKICFNTNPSDTAEAVKRWV